jgi:hypothetical protein
MKSSPEQGEIFYACQILNRIQTVTNKNAEQIPFNLAIF